MKNIGFLLTGTAVAIAIASSCLYVVDQRQFGVIYSLGEIKDVVEDSGLHVKMPPPFQNVRYLDKRLLNLDSLEGDVMQTAEKQRVVVDWYVRWRIVNPSQYIRQVGGTETIGSTQLNRVVRGVVQEQINKHTVKDLLSAKREEVMQDVKKIVATSVGGTKPWGIEIVDVRITRIDYVEAITDSVYRRMEAERKRVANELRSTGGADGEKIRADAERQRDITIANAYKDAQIIKGEGDAEAAALYASAFGKDPQFAKFYKSLDTYKNTFAKKSDVMVIDTSSDFFKVMRGSAANDGATAAASKGRK